MKETLITMKIKGLSDALVLRIEDDLNTQSLRIWDHTINDYSEFPIEVLMLVNLNSEEQT